MVDKLNQIRELNRIIKRLKEEHRHRRYSGTMVCPMCEGKLSVIHYRSNGLTRGLCATPECLEWVDC